LTEVQACLQIAFGNQTISLKTGAFARIFPGETHGFASLSRDRFALIVCNRHVKNSAASSVAEEQPATLILNIVQKHLSILSISALAKKALNSDGQDEKESAACLSRAGSTMLPTTRPPFSGSTVLCRALL
jgi:hypothetical protein